MKHIVARAALTTVLAASLAGCDRPAPVATPSAQPEAAALPDQAHVCEVHDWQGSVAERYCKVGRKVLFLPQTFGNEQLPVLFAAINCDLRYAVALTNGAVTCIYAGPLAASKHDAPAPAGSARPDAVR